MANSHVPKFGNWDNDNVPYTAYFENARRERVGGVAMMNPNDPMENPEAFKHMSGTSHHHVDNGGEEVKVSSHHANSHNNTRSHGHHRSRGSQSSERSRSDDQKRSMSKAGSSTTGSFSSSSHQRYRSGSYSSNDHHLNHQGAAIPKFGSWDVNDPKSGDGYSAIFSKVKEEKHIAPSHSPSMSTPPLNNCSNIKSQYEGHSFLSKYCCCLFSSSESK